MFRRDFLQMISALPFVGALVRAEPTLARPRPLVYAHAGEVVTCERGHLICEFVETVHIGETQNLPAQLGRWRQPEPKVGQMPFPRCAVCDAHFGVPGGIFHFKDGWRDPLGRDAERWLREHA